MDIDGLAAADSLRGLACDNAITDFGGVLATTLYFALGREQEGAMGGLRELLLLYLKGIGARMYVEISRLLAVGRGRCLAHGSLNTELGGSIRVLARHCASRRRIIILLVIPSISKCGADELHRTSEGSTSAYASHVA